MPSVGHDLTKPVRPRSTLLTIAKHGVVVAAESDADDVVGGELTVCADDGVDAVAAHNQAEGVAGQMDADTVGEIVIHFREYCGVVGFEAGGVADAEYAALDVSVVGGGFACGAPHV